MKILHAEIAEKSEECSLKQAEVSKLLTDLVDTKNNERTVRYGSKGVEAS